MIILLLGILLVSPLIFAEEQEQTQEQTQEQMETYAGFDRFVDNVKMFFSFGDKKVMMALEIREKEINSAMVNTRNADDEDADKNLKMAWKRLQFVQEKISLNVAEEVKENSRELRQNIINEGDLTEEFEVYVLEEEKTGLTAEWVIEVSGQGGQTSESGVVVEGTVGGNRVWEIETRIGEIDGEIANWVVENSVGKDSDGDNGLTWEVKNEIARGDDGLKPEVKNYVEGDGTEENEVVEDGNGGMAPGTTDGITPEDSSDGDCGDDVVCGGDDDVIEDTDEGETVDEGILDIGDGDNTVDDTVVDSGGDDDTGGVDDGPGDPGVVDED